MSGCSIDVGLDAASSALQKVDWYNASASSSVRKAELRRFRVTVSLFINFFPKRHVTSR